MYIYIYVHIYIYKHIMVIYTFVCMYTYIYIHKNVLYVCMYIYVYLEREGERDTETKKVSMHGLERKGERKEKNESERARERERQREKRFRSNLYIQYDYIIKSGWTHSIVQIWRKGSCSCIWRENDRKRRTLRDTDNESDREKARKREWDKERQERTRSMEECALCSREQTHFSTYTQTSTYVWRCGAFPRVSQHPKTCRVCSRSCVRVRSYGVRTHANIKLRQWEGADGQTDNRHHNHTHDHQAIYSRNWQRISPCLPPSNPHTYLANWHEPTRTPAAALLPLRPCFADLPFFLCACPSAEKDFFWFFSIRGFFVRLAPFATRKRLLSDLLLLLLLLKKTESRWCPFRPTLWMM